MKTTQIACRAMLLAAASLAVVCASAAREPKFPLSTYGRLPYLEDVSIAPDGKRLAFVRTSQDDRILVVVPLDGSKTRAAARVGATKLRELQWQDDDHLLVTVSSTSLPPIGFTGSKREWYQLVRFDIPSNKLHGVEFAVDDAQTFNVLSGDVTVRELGGKSTLFVPGLYVGDSEVLPGLFSMQGDHWPRLLVKGNEPSTEWLIDGNGRPVAQLEYRDTKKVWVLKSHRENRWETIATGAAVIDAPRLLGFDLKGEDAVVEFKEKGDAVWRPVSLKDGTMGKPLDDGNALAGLFTDPRDDRVIGGVSAKDDRHYVFFDNELQAHWNAILREYPDEVVHMASHSADFSRIVVEVFGAKEGFSYALYDWYAHQAIPLGNIYEGIKETAAEVRPITYKAADGTAISGFLTLPRGMEQKGLPLIVFPHGGPQYHDTNRFDWWAQAMADQGYAVLQPNFRGSNLTTELLEAGYGEWGRKMQTDLSDGVHYLAGEGIVDPKRVCIVGGSYGGYAALAGVTLQSGIYKCSVSVAGVADLVRMRDWEKRDHLGVVTRYWERFWGVGDKDDAALKAISPVDHVQGVEAPVLLIHGKDDTLVPFEQSDVMQSALKKAGKPVELVTLKHEDHWLSNSETRLQMLEATVAFLRAHNPPN